MTANGFAIPVDHRVRIKENKKKLEKYLHLTKEIKVVKYESDTNHSQRTLNNLEKRLEEKPRKENGGKIETF